MMREAGESGALDAAIHRLDRALSQLEIRVASLITEADAANGDLFDQDRANLAAELDRARGRERELEAAGAQASEALGRAIVEIRAALNEDESGVDAPEPDDQAEDDLGQDSGARAPEIPRHAQEGELPFGQPSDETA
ncbi:MAG: DUF4164 family protein [Caulobacteraceae bacterium]|nr:DUF4164 family protein [Caulobacteraceae bacterium]